MLQLLLKAKEGSGQAWFSPFGVLKNLNFFGAHEAFLEKNSNCDTYKTLSFNVLHFKPWSST